MHALSVIDVLLSSHPSIDAFAVALELLKTVSVESLPQDARQAAYNLIHGIISENSEGVQSVGVEFLDSFCTFMSGEKDPRCLLLCMDSLALLLGELNSVAGSKNVENAFDAVACYFPITFEPRPDDPVSFLFCAPIQGMPGTGLSPSPHCHYTPGSRKTRSAYPFFGGSKGSFALL